MAAAMISDRGLRKKLTQEVVLADKPSRKPSKPTKRKSPASCSKDKKQEQNNNQAKKPKTGDPKVDLFTSYQPWVIQTYGDLAKTKTITLKKYHRILRTLRGEESTGPDGAKFRFWVKAKGFHLGQPPGYDAKPADGIVCRYSVADADGCVRNPDGSEIYTGSQNDPALYIPTPPVKVDNSLLEVNVSDDDSHSELDPQFEESPPPPPPPPKPAPEKKKRRSSQKSAPYVLNTPSPRPITPFSIGASPFGVFPQTSPFILPTSSGASTPFLPPVGIATPLTASSLADIYAAPPKRRRRHADITSGSDNQESAPDPNDEFEMFGRLIANQLRKLPLGLALDTQLKIQTLVNAARIQAVYQQYSYVGPSQEASSVTALSNNILSNIMSQNTFSSRVATARAMREPSLDIKTEMDDSDNDEQL